MESRPAMHKTNLKIAGAFVVGLVAASGAWQTLNNANASNQETYRYLNLFGDVFDRVRADYVEEPDSEKLIDTAINGMLAGWQADETRAVQTRRVGFRGEVVRLNLANYVSTGALAGLVLAIAGSIIYFLAQQALAAIMPVLEILALVGFMGPIWIFIIVDTLAATGIGALGGVIYDRVFAAPGRR